MHDGSIVMVTKLTEIVAEPLRNLLIDRGVTPHPDDNPVPLLYLLDRMSQGTGVIKNDKAFLTRISDAHAAKDPRKRKALMQDIGDEILFALGLFPEALSSMQTSAPSLPYFAELGVTAYRHARTAAREYNIKQANLLENLADQFCGYAGALWELEQLVMVMQGPDTRTSMPRQENDKFIGELYQVLGERVIEIKRGLLTRVPEYPIKVTRENKN